MGRAVARPRGRGRRGDELRPTQARVRQALFNSLAARLEGARVLDLYAGSGAWGAEALHRGAAAVLFVEHTAKLAAGLRRHLEADALSPRAEIWRRDVLSAVRDLGAAQRKFDIIFLDPPYGRGLLAATLEAIAAAELLAPGGLAAAEGHWRDRPPEIHGLVRRREAKYGETVVWYFERAGGDQV